MTRERDIKADFDTVLAEALEGTAKDPEACLSLQSLTDLAEGSLTGQQRRELTDHVQVCPACASLVADLRTLNAPVHALHRGWLGWRGPVLATRGRLESDPNLARAWQQHVARCPACGRRTRWIEGLGALVRRPVLRQLPGFAAGVMALALLIVVLPPGGDPSGGAAPGASRSPDASRQPSEKGPPKRGPKKGPPVPDLSSQEQLQSLLDPAPEQLLAAIARWEAALAHAPDDLAAWEKLRQLYGRQAELQPDDDTRREWLDKQRHATDRLEELRSGL